MKTAKFLLLLFICSNLRSQSINDYHLERMYWNYRELCKKYFITIGPNNGESVVSDRFFMDNRSAAIYSDPFIYNGLTIPPRRDSYTGQLNEYWGYQNFGDATVDYDNYMGVLATEYWLLKHYKHDPEALNALKNEIYFTLYAIDRLDEYGDLYYQSTSHTKNGFFIRDDVPQDHMKTLRSYDGTYNWHRSNITSGLMHLHNLTINNEVVYFGPDALQIHKSNPGSTNEKRVETQIGKGAEMSQDQLFGILTGIKFFQTFIDWDLEVDPDGNNPAFSKKNIITWSAEITDRLMVHLTEFRTNIKWNDPETTDNKMIKKCKKKNNCGDNDPCPQCDTEDEWRMFEDKVSDPVLAIKANYVLVNPAKGDRHVWRGPYAFAFGYPLEMIGEQLANANQSQRKDYNSVQVFLDDEEKILAHAGTFVVNTGALSTISIAVSCISTPIAPETGLVKAQEYANAAFLECPGLTFLGGNGYSLCLLGRPLDLKNPNWWRDLWNAIPKKDFIRNAIADQEHTMSKNMICKLAAISGTWTHKDYVDFCEYIGYGFHDIFYALLNDKMPIKSKSFYENLLLNARKYGVLDESDHAPFNRNSIFSQPSSHNSGHEYNDLYNGNDFMLLYNLYRIADIKYWGSNQNKIIYREKSSVFEIPKETKFLGDVFLKHHSFLGYFGQDQNSSGPFYYKYREFIPYHQNEYDNNSQLINHVTTSISYDHSMNYGIRLPERLSHELTLNNNGKVTVTYDLYVNGPHLTLESGSEIETTSPGSEETISHLLKIQKGCSLILKNNSILRIANNTSVIIEEGAKLIYYPGARIILNGSNACLKFDQGQLYLKPGAEFKIESDGSGRGYVHFHHDWKGNPDAASIVCEDQTAIFKLVGSYSTPGTSSGQYGNDLLLKVTGNIGLCTDWKLKLFSVSKGFIAMGNGSKIVSNAITSNFNKCNINTLSNTEIDVLKHGGIEIPGRINKFEEVDINNANIGINFYNRGGQENLRLIGVITNNCNIGVQLLGGGFDISDNCDIKGHRSAINTYGSSKFSVVRNSNLEVGGFGDGERCDVLNFQGSRSLFAWKNVIRQGLSGVSVRDAKALLKCNTFNQNNTNLVWFNSPIVSMVKGYNSFESLCLRHLFGNGNTYFNPRDNYNRYIQPVNFTYSGPNDYKMFEVRYSWSSPWVIDNPSYTNGNNSCYDQGGGAAINLGSFPSDKYWFEVVENFNSLISTTAPLELKINTNLSLSAIASSISSGCTEFNLNDDIVFKNYTSYGGSFIPDQLYKRAMMPTIETLKENINTRPLIYTNAYSSTSYRTLNSALIANHNRIYDREITAYDSAIEEIGNILTRNAADDSLSFSPYKEDLYFLYELMNNAYSDMAFYRDTADTTFISMFDKVVVSYPKMDSTFMSLWEQSEDSLNLWYTRKFELTKDWAQVHRLANEKEKAIDVLEEGLVVLTDSIELESLQKWICVNQLEISLQTDTSLSWDSAILNHGCFFNKHNLQDSITERDTSISYCNWDKYFTDNTSGATFNSEDNLSSIQMISPENKFLYTNDSNEYVLSFGNYRLIYFDTLDLSTSIINLTVTADTPTIVNSDTSLHYCNWNDLGYPTFTSFSRLDSFDYTVVNDSSSRRVDLNWLTAGSYTLESYDILNCIVNKTRILVYSDSVYLNETDTSIFDSQYESYLSNFNGLNYHIYGSNRSILGPLVNCNKVGNYIIELYDSTNCSKSRINLEVLGDTVEIESHDSTHIIYYLPDTTTYTPVVEFQPEYESPFVLTSVYVDSTGWDNFTFYTSEDSNTLFLPEGKYIVAYFDTINCRKITVNLTIELQAYTTLYLYDTVAYSCQHEFNAVFYDVSDTGLMFDHDTNIIELSGPNTYQLDPQSGNYYYIVLNSYTNVISKTIISFEDLLAIPPTCDNYLEGSYNRAEGGPCCFVNISDILCEGDTVSVGDDISIYDMDSVFLFSTQVDSYNPYILGFKFCPPFWNTQSVHIHDSYTLVFKKSTCTVCCLNFMCDSMAFEDLSINTTNQNRQIGKTQNKSDNGNAFSNIGLEKSEFSITIFPNPANTEINIKMRGTDTGTITVNLFDLLGKSVLGYSYYKNTNSYTAQIITSDLASGVYTLYIPEFDYYYKLIIIR